MIKMRTQVVGWEEFFDRKPSAPAQAIVIEVERIRAAAVKAISDKDVIIKVAGVAAALLIGIPDVTHAAGYTVTGIDAAASQIYRKLLNVGKWVIIVKGGIDTIQSAISGDLQSAKRNFLSYLLVYVTLWALPWGLKQVDTMFADMGGVS